jgi:arylsulfatase A-like enzyme
VPARAIATPRAIDDGEIGGPPAMLGLATWLGAMTGLLELTILTSWHRIQGDAVLGALLMNRHFPWMIPVTHLSIFLGVGLPLSQATRLWPRWAWKAGPRFLGFLAGFALLAIVTGLHPAASAVLAAGLSWRLVRRLEGRARGFRTFVAATLPVALVVVAILGVTTFDRQVLAERRAMAALPTAPAGAPNVLLIVLDTVRADHLSLHGYPRETSPVLTRLARRGVVFDEARSAAPWTLPSHASLFTGRWPHELGVSEQRALDDTYPTLAEFLATRGYATAGFIGNTYFCNSWYGLGRGFAHFEDYYEPNVVISPVETLCCTAIGRLLVTAIGSAYNVRPDTANPMKDAPRVNRDAFQWLDDHRDRPFFAFLNYIDAHDPYLTPPGFDRHFGVHPESEADYDMLNDWYYHPRKDPTGRDARLLADSYDDCLAYLDEQLGLLFDGLERRGLLANTLVIVTADHGEHLGEHGLYGHGKSLYRPEVHVPLVVFGPTGTPAGRRVAAPVSLRDVPATIVERLGLAGSSPFPGHSLARFWGPSPAGTDGDDGPILSELDIVPNPPKHPDPSLPKALLGPLSAVADARAIYIRDALGREELYDPVADPGEAHDLAGSPSSRPALTRSRAVLERALAPPRRR